MIGQTVGKYRIVSRLGRGGMGTVYKAVDTTLDREVAIKVLNPDLAAADLLKRFRAEAMTLARMNHPNIATLFELCQHDDDLLMVMELVRGEAFDKLSERMGPLPVERAVYLCSQVLDALAHAHRAGIVHRDLKPANLMVSESGAVKVMDFGIARMMGTEHLTNDGYMMGTPAYMAPEQVLGNEVDGRADLYAVGVMMYRLLTGNLPFKADTAIAMVQKQIKDSPTPLRQFREGLPPWCSEVLDRALAKAPDDRFQTADEFRMALVRALAPAPMDQTSSVPAFVPPPAGAAVDLDMTVMPNAMPTPLWVAPPPPVVAQAPALMPPPVVVDLPAAGTAGGARPASAATSMRLSQAAAAGAIVILLIAGALILVPRGSRDASLAQPPSVAPPSSAAPSAAATTPAAPPPTAPSAEVSSAAPSSAASSSAASPEAVGAGAASSSAPTAPSAAARLKSESPAAANAGRAAPDSGNATARVPALPALSFAPVRLLLSAGTDGKAREQPVSLHLADGLITVTGGNAAPMKSIPYRDVIALFHSRSKDPKWLPPSGVAVPVAKLNDGKFSFLKQAERDWVIVRTKAEFVTLRPEAAIVARVISALEARTGLAVVRVAGKD